VPAGIVYSAWGECLLKHRKPNLFCMGTLDHWQQIQANAGQDSVAYHTAPENWEQHKKTSGNCRKFFYLIMTVCPPSFQNETASKK